MSHKILCANCHTHLYNYTGDFKGKPDLRQFVPARANISMPSFGKPMICKRCGQTWYMLRSNGSMIVCTDQGMKPKPPIGASSVVSFPQDNIMIAELMKNMTQGLAHEFKEDSHD